MPKILQSNIMRPEKKYYGGYQIITVDVEIPTFTIWGYYLNDALVDLNKWVVL